MIGDKLKELRTLKGYTLMQLEKISGVSYVQITRYENNKSKPTERVLNKLSKALGVDSNVFRLAAESKSIIKDEDLDKRYERLKEIIPEDDSNRKTLSDIFDLMIFKSDINQLLVKKE